MSNRNVPEADSPSTVSLTARRTIRATADHVFDTWTQPRHLMQWWGPGPVECPEAEIDLRVGGRFRIGNRFPDGAMLWISGEFERIEPPSLLVYTWSIKPGDESPSRVTVRFEPRDGGTEVVVFHERIADGATRDMHEQGWIGCLEGLAEYLEGDDALPEEAEEKPPTDSSS